MLRASSKSNPKDNAGEHGERFGNEGAAQTWPTQKPAYLDIATSNSSSRVSNVGRFTETLHVTPMLKSSNQTLVSDRMMSEESGKQLIEGAATCASPPPRRQAWGRRCEEEKPELCFEGLISHTLFSSELDFCLVFCGEGTKSSCGPDSQIGQDDANFRSCQDELDSPTESRSKLFQS